jgi:hypothetical protein
VLQQDGGCGVPVQDVQVQATNEGFAYGSCAMLEFVTRQGF